jgi:origin recognition complex subunit 5
MAAGAAPAADVKELLCARWPERREQISQLLGLIGEPHDHAMPMFVHGPPVTGKTSIVRDVLGTLGRPFAYTSLVDSHSPRLLLDALVEELAPHLRGMDEKDLRCDRMADLVSILRRGLPPGNPAVFVVIDEATRLVDWKGADALLPALMKLSELTERNVGCVLVATPGWDAFRSAAGARPPAPVFFDAYSKAQLQKVLLRERPPEADERLYSNFVASILPMYVATCRSLHELRALLQPLWRVYVEPWERARARAALEDANEDEKEKEKEEEKETPRREISDAVPTKAPGQASRTKLPEARQLFAMLQSGLVAAPGTGDACEGAEQTRGGAAGPPGPSAAGAAAEPDAPAARRRRVFSGPVLHAGLAVPLSSAALALGRGEWPVEEDAGAGAGKLDFDIPRLTKFMLVSAHLATMNRESVDRRLFGHMVEGTRAGTAASRGSKRRRGGAAADRQQDQASTAALEGPGAFNLERLLAYFRIVTKQAYDEDDAGSEELARELLSADVFMQISSMVALGLLTRVSGADALDSVRYRCDIGDDLARKIAANLRVNLDNYLFFV